jgi:hypothetical protein
MQRGCLSEWYNESMARESKTVTAEIPIAGIACASCVQKIEKALLGNSRLRRFKLPS